MQTNIISTDTPLSKGEEMQIDMLLNFLSAYSPRVVEAALERKNHIEKEEQDTQGWQIWPVKSPPPPPHEWMQVNGRYYHRFPTGPDGRAPDSAPVSAAVQNARANSGDGTAKSSCQKCSDPPQTGGVVKGLVGLAKAQFGYDRTSNELTSARKSICSNCRHNDIGRCGICGCYLHAKIRIKKEKCPQGRW